MEFWAFSKFTLKVCLSARIPRDATSSKKDSSSEELTLDDVNKMERELAEVMPPKNAERFANVMRKFTKDASSAENMEGVVRLNLFILLQTIFIDFS